MYETRSDERRLSTASFVLFRVDENAQRKAATVFTVAPADSDSASAKHGEHLTLPPPLA